GIRLVGASEDLPAFERLKRALSERGLAPELASESAASVIELVLDGATLKPQGYRLQAEAGRVRIEARDAAGLFYGVCTLQQLLALEVYGDGRARVPTVVIEDFPDFAQRGVMLDVSRDKVPTMDTLFGLVDRLASLKLNQLQLYVEHTFAYAGHERVWQHASPFLPGEMQALDTYCRERHVELVPNQNSFGHLQRWLIHEPYRRLAECPEGFEHPWNPSREPFSLCAVDPKTFEFLSDLYDQLLPNFKSGLFNVGCDETIDLGLGRSKQACTEQGTERVYLEYLQKINRLVRARGRRMQFWGDIIIKRPELIPELPADAIAMEWGYEADHPFADHAARFASAGLEFYVCPGTSSWNSIAGRTHNALANIKAAVSAGLEHGATGVLNTDWGDNGHLQPLPVSYLGFLAGAALSWNSEVDVAERELMSELLDQHFFGAQGAGLGRVAYDLGNAYQKAGAEPHNNSLLFQLLMASPGAAPTHGATRETLERAKEHVVRVAGSLNGAGKDRSEASVASGEFSWAARLLSFSCDLGQARLGQSSELCPIAALAPERRKLLAEQLGGLIDEHHKIWLSRNRPGGLSDSVARLERTRSELAGDL
ncbi:MAG TPA: family 20 glycosylhydrolase, partial [Polyangiaceae bacterium]|nr:family 20 glycosylhydrolase [Polyangiaceae bacterium]